MPPAYPARALPTTPISRDALRSCRVPASAPSPRPQTPVAIAQLSSTPPARTVAVLDDEHLKSFAAQVSRYWQRLHRINLSLILGPIALAVLLAPHPLARLVALLPFLLLPFHLTGYLLARRLVKDEVTSLGFEPATAAAVLDAWSKGQRSITPVFSRAKAERFLLVELTVGRARARGAERDPERQAPFDSLPPPSKVGASPHDERPAMPA